MHTLIVIGWAGVKHAYLDIPENEAIARWIATEGYSDERDNIPLKIITFEDVIGVYDAWEVECYASKE